MLVDDFTNFEIYLPSTSKAAADRGKKRGRCEYLENKKSFLAEVKSIFHSFLKDYHLVRNRNFVKNSGHKL